MAATRIRKADLGANVFAANTVALGTAASAGTSGQAIQTDDTILAFDVTAPTTSAVADAASAGAAAVAARRDHVHGREAFATNAIVLAASAAAGAATTLIRSDATIAAFDATSPSTQAFGDSAVVGVAAFAARRDHKHAMPAGYTTANFVDNEVPSGTINSINDTFTLANTPIAGSQHLYKNGVRQNPGGGLDYTISTATITFLAGNIPQTSDVLLVDYRK